MQISHPLRSHAVIGVEGSTCFGTFRLSWRIWPMCCAVCRATSPWGAAHLKHKYFTSQCALLVTVINKASRGRSTVCNVLNVARRFSPLQYEQEWITGNTKPLDIICQRTPSLSKVRHKLLLAPFRHTETPKLIKRNPNVPWSASTTQLA